MDKLFEIEKIITINPYNIDEIKIWNLTSEMENRLKGILRKEKNFLNLNIKTLIINFIY